MKQEDMKRLTELMLAASKFDHGLPITTEVIDTATLLAKTGHRDFTKVTSYYDLTEAEVAAVVQAGLQPKGVTLRAILDHLRLSGQWQHELGVVPAPPTEPVKAEKLRHRQREPRWKSEA